MASPLLISRDQLGKHGIESGSIYNSTTSHPMDCATCHGHPMGDSRVIKLRRQQVPPILCRCQGRGYSFLTLPYLSTFLPQTTAVKICKLFPHSLERQDLNWKLPRLGTFPPAPPTPFHSLSPRQDHHSTQPTPHSGTCQSFNSSESSSSPRSSPSSCPSSSPILIKRDIPSHLPPPLPALPPPRPNEAIITWSRSSEKASPICNATWTQRRYLVAGT